MKDLKGGNQISWLLLSAAIGVMLCIFAPLEIYLTNQTEFWFGFSQILPVLLVVFTGFSILLTGLFYFIQKIKWAVYIYGAVFCLLMFLYVQGNYLPRNYGVLNGVEIDWDSYASYAAASMVLLAAVIVIWLAICLKIKDKIYPLGSFICMILILLQLATVGILYIQNHIMNKNETSNVVVTSEKMFELSQNKNIIVFILDTFDSYYMKELLNSREGSKYREVFQNFTYYPDTLGVYPTTKGALPQILTGVEYENEKPYTEYVRNAYTKNQIYSVLKEKEYSVGVYTDSLYVNPDPDIYANVKEGKYVIGNYFDFAKGIFKLTAFQYMPHQFVRRSEQKASYNVKVREDRSWLRLSLWTNY